MPADVTTGYAPVNDVELYYESHGTGGIPLILVHGGYGLTTVFAGLISQLAASRQVIAVELQGHGHTRDTGRPFTFQAFGDDLAALIGYLGLGPADLLGVSLGGGASLRCAIAHPDVVRKLIVVSFPFRRDAWYPEVRAAFDNMSSAGLAQMQQSPAYAQYAAVAPDPGGYGALIDQTGQLLRQPFDWGSEVAGLAMPVQLVFADEDSIPVAHAAEFFGLLGGGISEPGWDGSFAHRHRLAVLPGQTHYSMYDAPELAPVVASFLA
jgi:pimeloyl-ACP methyl ester carboxylesterase